MQWSPPLSDYEIITSLSWRRGTKINHEPSPSFTFGARPDQVLQCHHDRLIEGARAHEFRGALKMLENDTKLLTDALSEHLATHSEGDLLRIRISLTLTGTLNVTSATLALPLPGILYDLPSALTLFSQTPASLEPSRFAIQCQVQVSSHSTSATTFTRHKTSHRIPYNDARSSLCKPLDASTPPYEREVLLYNPLGEVTEASLSTPYFYRSGRWITPLLICGGCISVSRRLILELELVGEDVVRVEELEEGEIIWLSNAVRGWWLGRLNLGTTPSGYSASRNIPS